MRATQRLPFQYLLHRGVGEDATTFSGVLHFTLDTYLIMMSVKQGSIMYHFLSFLVWLDPVFNFDPPGRWRTLYHWYISNDISHLFAPIVYSIWPIDRTLSGANILDRRDKLVFSLFVNIPWLKHFSICSTHSSHNFTWFCSSSPTKKLMTHFC